MNVNDFLKKKAELEELISQHGKDMITGLVKDFCQKEPNIRGIRWAQYTPYFNDGEACVFRLSDVYFYYGGNGKPELSDEDWENDAEEGGFHYAKSKSEIDFSEKLELIEDALLSVFGDHVEVKIAVEDGNVTFVTEHYEHE